MIVSVLYVIAILGGILFSYYDGYTLPSWFLATPSPLTTSSTVITQPKHPSFHRQPQEVSIRDLLKHGQTYHQQVIKVRGVITQPELHLDDTQLYLDFVFRLSQGADSIIVYGRHDRTQSAPSIVTNHSAQVVGTFWIEQHRNGLIISNILEAYSVTPYPPSIPDRT